MNTVKLGGITLGNDLVSNRLVAVKVAFDAHLKAESVLECGDSFYQVALKYRSLTGALVVDVRVVRNDEHKWEFFSSEGLLQTEKDQLASIAKSIQQDIVESVRQEQDQEQDGTYMPTPEEIRDIEDSYFDAGIGYGR